MASRVKRDVARRGEQGEDDARVSAVKRQHALILENDEALILSGQRYVSLIKSPYIWRVIAETRVNNLGAFSGSSMENMTGGRGI